MISQASYAFARSFHSGSRRGGLQRGVDRYWRLEAIRGAACPTVSERYPLFCRKASRFMIRAKFTDRLANDHCCALKSQAGHNCGHNDISPSSTSPEYAKSGTQDGQITEHVVAGADPRRSHVGV